MFDFDVKDFLDKYFEENDSKLMQQLDETIGNSEEPTEISALSDLVFRNYISEAFSEAIKENNKFILSKVKEIVEVAYSKVIQENTTTNILQIPKELKDELDLD